MPRRAAQDRHEVYARLGSECSKQAPVCTRAVVGVAEEEPSPRPVVHNYRSVGEGWSRETQNILIDSSHVVDILSSITTERAGTKSNHSDKEKTI